MSKNIVSLLDYKKAKAPAVNQAHAKKRLSNVEASEIRRAAQVKALVEKAKAEGGYVIGVGGERISVNEASAYGFNFSDRWRSLAPRRPGSEEHNKIHKQKAHYVVTTHYPLIDSTVYSNYLKRNGMYYCQASIYQRDEVVPSFHFASWVEDIKEGVNLIDAVAEESLKRIVTELKRKYSMSLIDFDATKDIHYRSLKKNFS